MSGSEHEKQWRSRTEARVSPARAGPSNRQRIQRRIAHDDQPGVDCPSNSRLKLRKRALHGALAPQVFDGRASLRHPCRHQIAVNRRTTGRWPRFGVCTLPGSSAHRLSPETCSSWQGGRPQIERSHRSNGLPISVTAAATCGPHGFRPSPKGQEWLHPPPDRSHPISRPV